MAADEWEAYTQQPPEPPAAGSAMTLREAIDVVAGMVENADLLLANWGDEPTDRGIGEKLRQRAEAVRTVLDAARRHADDTAEIPAVVTTPTEAK